MALDMLVRGTTGVMPSRYAGAVGATPDEERALAQLPDEAKDAEGKEIRQGAAPLGERGDPGFAAIIKKICLST